MQYMEKLIIELLFSEDLLVKSVLANVLKEFAIMSHVVLPLAKDKFPRGR
jgi:hypothetical protein